MEKIPHHFNKAKTVLVETPFMYIVYILYIYNKVHNKVHIKVHNKVHNKVQQ